MAHTNRRAFLKTVGAGAAMAAAPGIARSAQESRRVVVGMIGPGGMGMQHIRLLAGRKDVDIAWLCDTDQQHLDAAAQHVQSTTGKAPKQTKDLRHVLDDRKVDAVFIATPDHWHAPASILALDAGKHVYVEKPCCHNIREGRLLVDAVERSGKCLQVGTQSRSSQGIQEALQRLREGEIGEILVVKAWNSQLRSNIGHEPVTTPPRSVDYDLWVGPAPMTPYRANLFHSNWRWCRNFGCGDIGNDGVHDIDICCWGLGAATHPQRVACLGGKYFFDDDQQFPDTQYAAFEYPVNATSGRSKQFIFEQRIWSPYTQEGYSNGAVFYGTKGHLVVGHSYGWKLYGPRIPGQNKSHLLGEGSAGGNEKNLIAHHGNFLDCVRGDQRVLRAPVLDGHFAATLVHLANIAAREGSVLEFDPRSERITNNEQAAAMTRRQYRDGHWAVPNGV